MSFHIFLFFSETLKQDINQNLTKKHLNNTYNTTTEHMIIYSNIRIK